MSETLDGTAILRIKREHLDALIEEANEKDISTSELIRRIIAKYLEKK